VLNKGNLDVPVDGQIVPEVDVLEHQGGRERGSEVQAFHQLGLIADEWTSYRARAQKLEDVRAGHADRLSKDAHLCQYVNENRGDEVVEDLHVPADCACAGVDHRVCQRVQDGLRILERAGPTAAHDRQAAFRDHRWSSRDRRGEQVATACPRGGSHLVGHLGTDRRAIDEQGIGARSVEQAAGSQCDRSKVVVSADHRDDDVAAAELGHRPGHACTRRGKWRSLGRGAVVHDDVPAAPE
jgi:hypothetical protein